MKDVYLLFYVYELDIEWNVNVHIVNLRFHLYEMICHMKCRPTRAENMFISLFSYNLSG